MPDEETKSPIKVKFAFKKPDDYQLYFVNGAFGGFTPQGDLVCNFYFESRDLPPEQEGKIEGTELKMDALTMPLDFIREMRCGIIMGPQQLYIFKEWFDKKVKEFEQKFVTKEESCEQTQS
jgi:hypothetical protein